MAWLSPERCIFSVQAFHHREFTTLFTCLFVQCAPLNRLPHLALLAAMDSTCWLTRTPSISTHWTETRKTHTSEGSALFIVVMIPGSLEVSGGLELAAYCCLLFTVFLPETQNTRNRRQHYSPGKLVSLPVSAFANSSSTQFLCATKTKQYQNRPRIFLIQLDHAFDMKTQRFRKGGKSRIIHN